MSGDESKLVNQAVAELELVLSQPRELAVNFHCRNALDKLRQALAWAEDERCTGNTDGD